jgi:hypothetical protein
MQALIERHGGTMIELREADLTCPIVSPHCDLGNGFELRQHVGFPA